MWRIKKSLFLQLALLILLGAGIVLLTVIKLNQRSVRPELLAMQNAYNSSLVSNATQQVDHFFKGAEKPIDELVIKFEYEAFTKKSAENILEKLLKENPSIYGSAIALTESQSQKSDFSILYAHKKNSAIHIKQRENVINDYQSDWFYLPYYLKRSIWTDPYMDTDVNILMISYSAPVIISGEVVAVITCDLALDKIHEQIKGLELGKEGSGILLNQRGRHIIHPNPQWVLKETLYSLMESITDLEDKKTIQELSQRLLNEEMGVYQFNRIGNKEKAWLYFNTIESTGWKLGYIIDQEKIFSPIKKMNQRMILLTIIGIILLLIPAFIVSLTITKPLNKLCKAADKLALGDFNTSIEMSTRNDEVGRLINDFDIMRRKLKQYIDTLAKTTAEKEKIASELNIAREIQHGILPKIFPPFPDRNGLDLFAILESAKEVGGDLYDFMLLDNDHLYICIGDVSGKGVPASLFMATGKTLLKSTIQTIKDPAKALSHVNNELSEGNDACMFITTFCGILNLESSELIYANAGHNPPLIISENENKFLAPAPSPPLAAFEGIEYENESVFLNAEDQFLLYTDGVTEAMNPDFVEYGEDRLQDFFKNTPALKAEKTLEKLLKELRTFANGAEQSDDITMLCFSYDNSKNTVESNPFS